MGRITFGERDSQNFKMDAVGKNWLVAIDGSTNSESAFNFAIQTMDKEKDHLHLIDVAEKIQTQLYAHAYVSMDFILDAQHKLDDHHKKILRKHSQTAHSAGVKNVHLMLANSDSPGEMICTAAREKKIDTIVIGRRGMGMLKRLLLGSVSRYVLENAPCDVMVIKQEYGPEEQHETTKAEVRQAEEIERQRRIEEDKKLDQTVQKTEQFQSELDRNVTRLAEEEERLRRIKELDERHKREQREREEELKKVKQQEEEERQRRVKEDPEAHIPMPFKEIQIFHKKVE